MWSKRYGCIGKRIPSHQIVVRTASATPSVLPTANGPAELCQAEKVAMKKSKNSESPDETPGQPNGESVRSPEPSRKPVTWW